MLIKIFLRDSSLGTGVDRKRALNCMRSMWPKADPGRGVEGTTKEKRGWDEKRML